MSIRYKIFGAFSVVILLACGLAFYGIRGISTSGDLVVRLYDGPLMGINHARSAHAGLNEARLIMQRSLSEGRPRAKPSPKFEKLVGNISKISGRARPGPERQRQRRPGEGRSQLRGWSGAGLKILKPRPAARPRSRRPSVAQLGDDAAAALDDLVETGGRLWLRLPRPRRKHRCRRHLPPCSGSRSAPHSSAL